MSAHVTMESDAMNGMMVMAMALQQAACPVPAPVPTELTGWATPRAAAAGMLTVGTATTVALVPGARFAVAPEKAPPEGATGATLAVTIAKAGRYRIALGTSAWIDLIAAGKPVASIAHGHGPACSGVAKMVDFQLAPGRYALQLSGARRSATTVMVAASK